MAEFDTQLNRLTVKLVYYGPALSGKTTNLTRLHDLLSPQMIGDMMALETEGDRTLFFDLLPLGFRAPSGMLVKFKLFTVPGQVQHDGTRKAVLSRADGIVFVADSQVDQKLNNGASFDNLLSNARALGMDLETLPLVVQFNKRDLPDIEPEEAILQRWSSTPWPLQFASALDGNGVKDTFSLLLGKTFDRLDQIAALEKRHRVSRDLFLMAAGAAA